MPTAAPPGTDNPLPACPDTPNCTRTSRHFQMEPDALFAAAQDALASLGPTLVHTQPADRRAQAVFRVALVFKDDVDLAVTPHPDGSVLHVRSASRVGHGDFGVNRRRVDRFFSALAKAF